MVVDFIQNDDVWPVGSFVENNLTEPTKVTGILSPYELFLPVKLRLLAEITLLFLFYID